MYKKKEILCIIIILCITLGIAFIPRWISKEEKEDVIVEEEESITIIVTGEIMDSSITLELPSGVSYRYIISRIEKYLNPYSVMDSNMTARYYKDTTIVIESSDTSCYESGSTSGKIRISTASMDELVGLYGIGQKRAQTIIEYRQAHTIDSWEALRSLLGVSNEIIEAIKEKAVL